MKRYSMILAVFAALVAAPAASASEPTHTNVYSAEVLDQNRSGVFLPVFIKIVTDRPNVSFSLARQGVAGEAGLVGPLKPTRVEQTADGKWDMYLTVRKVPETGVNYDITSPDVLYHEDNPQGVAYSFRVAKFLPRLTARRSGGAVVAHTMVSLAGYYTVDVHHRISVQRYRNGKWHTVSRVSKTEQATYTSEPPVVVSSLRLKRTIRNLAKMKRVRVVFSYRLTNQLGRVMTQGRVVRSVRR